MENNPSSSDKNIDKNINEFVLFSEDVKDKNEECIENSKSDIETISDEEFMLECARYGDIDDLINLFYDNKNIDINYKDDRKNTALHMAAANGHLEIVELLVKKGCDLNCQNNSGNTALHWAATNGQKNIIEFLLNKGAEFTIKNNQGKVPAEEAYDKQFYEISEILVDKEIEMKKYTGVKVEKLDENNKEDKIDLDDLTDENKNEIIDENKNEIIDKNNLNNKGNIESNSELINLDKLNINK